MKENKFNAGDETQVKERKTKAELKREKQLEELRAICQDRRVRDFIWRLLSTCGPYRQSFTGNSQTFFNEGLRKIGTHLIAELDEADVKIYNQMRLEQGDN